MSDSFGNKSGHELIEERTVFYRIEKCHKFVDHRGQLVEFFRRSDLGDFPSEFGQIYVVTFDSPGKIRGNHFHTEGVEAFGCVYGELEVALEDVHTKERVEFVLRADNETFQRLRIGAYVAHAFRNISPTAILVDYCSEQFNPEKPDRNPYILFQ